MPELMHCQYCDDPIHLIPMEIPGDIPDFWVHVRTGNMACDIDRPVATPDYSMPPL